MGFRVFTGCLLGIYYVWAFQKAVAGCLLRGLLAAGFSRDTGVYRSGLRIPLGVSENRGALF